MNKENDNQPIDTTIDIITPENIRFSYQIAGPFLRMITFLFDALFMGLFFIFVLIIASIIFDSIRSFNHFDASFINYGVGFIFILFFLVFWFGNAFLEAIFNGQTFGKMIFGIRSLTIDGQPINFRQAVLRNTIRMVDLMLGPFLILFMGCNNKMMRFGDIAAGTMVVLEDTEHKNRAIIRFKHPEIKAMIEKIPGDFEISPELSRALSIYVHRRTAVSLQRRWEIAYPLASRLLHKMKWKDSLNPDLVLCSVHQWNLDREK